MEQADRNREIFYGVWVVIAILGGLAALPTAAQDLCPSVAGDQRVDADNDGVGDLCDNCPGLGNPDQADLGDLDLDTGRADGVGDACDNCALAFNPREVIFLEDFQTLGMDLWSHEAFGGGVDTWHLATSDCFGDRFPSRMYVSNGNATREVLERGGAAWRS